MGERQRERLCGRERQGQTERQNKSGDVCRDVQSNALGILDDNNDNDNDNSTNNNDY
jgi:hypothetical protein